MNPRVKNVHYKRPYQLLLTFTNDEEKIFNFKKYLDYPVFCSLKDEAFCNKVHVRFGTVAWDDEIDIDPDTLYLESNAVDAINGELYG